MDIEQKPTSLHQVSKHVLTLVFRIVSKIEKLAT